MSTADLHTGCPSWCTSAHATVKHCGIIAEWHLDGMTVTIGLAHAEAFGNQPHLGPHASIDIACDGVGMELDLTPGQVRMLERALNAEGGAQYFCEALAATVTTLEGCIPE